MSLSSPRGMTLLEALVVIAIVSILAAVAIPAFIMHMRRARTAEAIDQLDKIFKGAATYFMTPQVEESTGVALPCQFPGNEELTPDITVGMCCHSAHDQDGDRRCDVDPEQWESPTWQALNFEMREQHYFQYMVETEEMDPSTTVFIGVAVGNQDCDEEVSSFVKASIGFRQSATDCQLVGLPALYTEQETE